MMLFLGVLSVFQLTLLPGLLLVRLFPGKRSFIQQLIYVFMLSLLANYLAVFLLVTLHLYLRGVVLVLFGLEVALLAWITRRQWSQVFVGEEIRIRDGISNQLHYFGDWIRKDFWSASLYFVCGLVALLSIIWVLWAWVTNFNTVFQTWDAWATWDLWGMKWADNRFPGDTYEYPQLIPVAFSLSYKFIGTTAVKFFGKSIMPLFTLMVVLMLFDLGKKHRSFGYMLGAGFALYSIVLLLGEYIPEGYVDIPVACLSFMAIYTLLHARNLKDKGEIKSILLLGSLCTATAAVTKQTGLYVMIFYPLLAYLWVLKPLKGLAQGAAITLLAKNFLMVLVLVLPWYAFVEFRILSGSSTSAIQNAIYDIHQGRTLPERFVAAVDSLGGYIFFFIFALLSLLVLDNTFRQIVVFLILPFSILWALFLGYEDRNLAVAIPLLSMVVGVAAENWFVRLRAGVGKRPVLRLPALAVLILGALILGGSTLPVDDEILIQRQLSEQRKIFEPALNDKLYRFFSREGGPEPIITNYPVGWLPGLEDIWRNEIFQDYDAYRKTLQRFPDVTLILVPTLGINQEILDELQQFIDVGTYQVIFREGAYILVRIPSRVTIN
jgi:hypothetical protein